MASMLASSVLDRGLELRSGQTNDGIFGICCFSDKNSVYWSKSEDRLARDQDNVSVWSNMYSFGLVSVR
jgi:hypothetical protein